MARRKRKTSSRRRVKRGFLGRFMKNPARKRRVKRRAAKRSTIMIANPAPRRRRKRRSFRSNPIRKYRRNPIRIGGGRGKISFGAIIGPAMMAGLGGVAADALMGYAPLPAMLTTGKLRYVTKAVLSVGAGMAVARFGSRKLGESLALGGLAIAIHDAAREQLTSLLPGVKYGEYVDGMGYYASGQPVGQAGMGEYLGEIDYGGDQSGTLGDMFAARDFGRTAPYLY